MHISQTDLMTTLCIACLLPSDTDGKVLKSNNKCAHFLAEGLTNWWHNITLNIRRNEKQNKPSETYWSAAALGQSSHH